MHNTRNTQNELPAGFTVRKESNGAYQTAFVLRHNHAFVSAHTDKESAIMAAFDMADRMAAHTAIKAAHGDDQLMMVSAIQERIGALSNELAGVSVVNGDWDLYLQTIQDLYARRAALITRIKGYHLEEDSQCPY